MNDNKIIAQKMPVLTRDIVGKMTAEFFEHDETQGLSRWKVKDSQGDLFDVTLDDLFPDGQYIYNDVSSQEYGEKLIKLIRNVGPEEAKDILHASNGKMKKQAYADYSKIDLEQIPEEQLVRILLTILGTIPINDEERQELDNMSKRIKEIMDARKV